jgi:hypothetical protein
MVVLEASKHKIYSFLALRAFNFASVYLFLRLKKLK